jgi:hypothetical protein
MIQSDDIAGSTYPFVPAKSRASFNCQGGDVEGQKCTSVLGGLFCGTLIFNSGSDNVTAKLSEGSGYSLTVQTTLSGADNGNFTFSGSAVANVMFVSGTVDGTPFSLFGYFDSKGAYTGVPNSIAVFDYNTLAYEGLLVEQ